MKVQASSSNLRSADSETQQRHFVNAAQADNDRILYSNASSAAEFWNNLSSEQRMLMTKLSGIIDDLLTQL